MGGGGGGEGVLVFEIWTKREVMKNRSEIGGLVERVGSLRKGGFQIVSSVFLKKMNTIGIKGITIGTLFFVW